MKVIIDSKDQGQRTDKFVELKLKDLGFDQVTRSMIKEDIPKGVEVNGKEAKPSYKFKIGDSVEINREFWEEYFENKDLSEEIMPQEGELEILFEDDDILVLVKPKGLVVHPGVGNRSNTLANYIKHYLQSKDEFDINMDRAGIVHRLDKGVSGIMVVAKNKVVQEKLKKQFSRREVEKLYLAQVKKYKPSELSSMKLRDLDKTLKNVVEDEAEYNEWFKASGYIGRDRNNRYKMAFKLYEFGGSKKAQSYILPVGEEQLLIKIVTGRMHQIRATLYYYCYYIKGDTLYKPGNSKESSDEIMLKSIYLSFKHPTTGERVSFIKK